MVYEPKGVWQISGTFWSAAFSNVFLKKTAYFGANLF